MNRKSSSPICSVLRTAYCCLLISLLLSCGTKSPPSLKVYEKPEAASMVQVAYREDMLVLSWNYPDNLRPAIKGFRILRSEDGAFERIALVDSDESSYTDRDFKLNHAYKYKLVTVSQKDVLSDTSKVIAVTPVPLPSPPVNIRFAVKPEAVELAWDSSGEGICYNIYKSASRGSSDAVLISSGAVCATAYRDGAITPDSPAYYTLRALSSGDIRGEGYPSAEIEVAPSDFVPSPPSDLRIAKGDNATFLSWKEGPEYWVKGYRVYRKAEGGAEFVLVGEVRAPAFVDSLAGRKVRYRIKAVGPAAESGPLEGE